MPKKNDFKLDVVSVRLVKDAPIYSEHTFNNPADIAAVMGAVSYTHLATAGCFSEHEFVDIIRLWR